LIGTLFPDEVYVAYSEAKRWVAAAGPTEKLPASVSMPPGSVGFSRPSRKPYVVLPAKTVLELTKGGTWQPTGSEIGGLEAGLPQIAYLKADNWPDYNVRIDHPEEYFRQYVAVLRKGKRMIYVNAFRENVADWSERFVMILDGGTCCWQALYDPAAHTFAAFTINGVA
jgi:hypothetical protein